VALVLALFMALPGCGRFDVRNRPARGAVPAEPLSVTVEVYQTHGAKRRAAPERDGVITSLLYRKDGRWQVVSRSARGRWSQGGLVPGRYRLQVAGLLGPDGQLEPMKGPRTRDFDLRDGQAAYADVVVKRSSNALKVLLVVTIVAVLVLAILQILDGDLGLDLADVLAPIAAIPRMLITYPEVWLEVLLSVPPPPPPAFYDARMEMEHHHGRPYIEDYWPTHGSKLVPADATVRIEFDRPMSAWTLSPNTIHVSGSESGEIVRGVEVLERGRAVLVDPLRDLRPGETVTVTLYGESIASEEGEALDESYRFSFEVAPAASATQR
jgi:hypothetical protein